METNTRLTEQVIVGTKHVEVQEKLLEKGDALAGLETAMDIARTFRSHKGTCRQAASYRTIAGGCGCVEEDIQLSPALQSMWNVAWIKMGGMPSASTEMSRLLQMRTLRSGLSHWIVANECIIGNKRSAKTKVVWSEEGNFLRKECQQRGSCGGGLRNTHFRGCGNQRHLD